MRIGFGYDSHQFTSGNYVILAGVQIPFDKAIKAHSDGDVVYHAVADALLGAASLQDLGTHFPDNDPKYRGVSSAVLLQNVFQLIQNQQYEVNNIDITVIIEAPKLQPYILMMRNNLTWILKTSLDQVSVKAKTNEKMGWIGRGEGLAAQAVVLLNKVKQ